MGLKVIFNKSLMRITDLIAEDKEFWYGWIGIFIYIGIDLLDSQVTRPMMKASGLKYEVECHDDPSKCWIIKKSK